MLLEIDDNKQLSELQEKFNECFPYLKIEFYKHTSDQQKSSKPRLESDQLIGSVSKHHESGILEIKSWDKTGNVVKRFRKKFGLNVQIFRLHNGHWVQTAKIADLTLQEQSYLAEQSLKKSKPVNNTESEEAYYDL